MLARFRDHALLLTVMLVFVPVACGGEDTASDADGDSTEATSDSGSQDTTTGDPGAAADSTTETTTFSIADDLEFSVPSDWQSLGAGVVGSEEFVAPQANVSVRGPEARRETYGELVAEGDDFATVAAAEAETLAGDSAEPEIDGTIATVEMEVAGAEAMVVVVDLGNGEYASVFVSAAGENPIPDETKEAVRKVAASMTPG